MRRHRGPGWAGKGYRWNATTEWSGRGAEEWRVFGRKMARRFFMFFALLVLTLVGLGALIATGLAGLGGLQRAIVVLLTPFLLLGALALVVRYASRTWVPVRDLIATTGRLADGDYTARVTTPTARSLRPVVSSFNRMATRLEDSDEQRRRLLADLGHELRTPLTVVRGEIEAMLDGVHPSDDAHLEPLLEEVAVMERLLEDLRTLSLAEAGALALHAEPTDVAALLEDVAGSYRRTATEQGVIVDVAVEDGLGEVLLDAVRIREVVANLVVNSLRAMPDGGALRLGAKADGSLLQIQVSDSGLGMTDAELETVFERFQRGSTSTGSGLGLTISRDLVEAHGGSIAIESTPAVGTRVRVTLPRARPL